MDSSPELRARERGAAWRTAALLAIATAALLWPAIYNRFPLVFPDTGAYFSVAWAHLWTLDRSPFYGFYLRMLSGLDGTVQVWAGIVVQSAAVALCLLLALGRLAPSASSKARLAIVLLLAVGTSLPWHASQLMPDAFTGPTVLLAWLASTRNPSEAGSPLLWFAAFLATLTHYTHLPLFVLTVAVTLLAEYWSRKATLGALLRRAAAAAFVVALVLASLTFTNAHFLGRWSAVPTGPAFLFARLHEDGFVQPWLAAHCPHGDAPVLCSIRDRLPRDSQELLWNVHSPFNTMVWKPRFEPGDQEILDELRRASLGGIEAQPVAFAKVSSEAAASQFVHFAVLDDECPAVCRNKDSAVYSRFKTLRPELFGQMLASRQLQGSMPKSAWRLLTTPASVLGLLLLPLLCAVAIRRRDSTSAGFLLAVISALVANAWLAGALSDVHDRYQSRVVWLAPFAVLAVLARWYSERRASAQPA